MRKILVGMLSLFFVLSFSSAYAVTTLNYVDGVVQTTAGLTGYATYDDDIYGMTVAVTSSAGAVTDYVWGDLGSGSSGVSAGGFSLSFNGDSWDASWSLTSGTSISSIFFDAGAGDAVFDVLNGSSGTTGSANGWAFDPTYAVDAFDITATYSGAVQLDGAAAPVGDLYRYLNLQFDPGFGSSDSLSFRADMDSLSISGDIDPVDPVPEPGTILLLGTGLIGLAIARKRMKK